MASLERERAREKRHFYFFLISGGSSCWTWIRTRARCPRSVRVSSTNSGLRHERAVIGSRRGSCCASRRGTRWNTFATTSTNPRAGTLTWPLDYTRKLDLGDAHGQWHVAPQPMRPEWSRVTYSADLRLRGGIPKFIVDAVSKKALVGACCWVKTYSEKESQSRCETAATAAALRSQHAPVLFDYCGQIFPQTAAAAVALAKNVENTTERTVSLVDKSLRQRGADRARRRHARVSRPRESRPHGAQTRRKRNPSQETKELKCRTIRPRAAAAPPPRVVPCFAPTRDEARVVSRAVGDARA